MRIEFFSDGGDDCALFVPEPGRIHDTLPKKKQAGVETARLL
jgi:hypothetical protein